MKKLICGLLFCLLPLTAGYAASDAEAAIIRILQDIDAKGGTGGGGGGAATIADGADVTQGAKADAKSTATDATPISSISILKQISASVQAPPSQAVTNAGTFAVQAGNFPTTVDTNSGSKSASTLRVVLATDQPALTNKLLVTPDSVALPANQSVNVSQINGVTTLMGAGATGTGSIRITPATPATITTGQVTAGAAATLVAANTSRALLTVRNTDATLSVYVGPATVTSANGVLIKAGESRVFRGATLLQVIAPSGSPVVDYVDETY